MNNGITYYVEQATKKYGNKKLLVNKQMIKTGLNDIPSIHKEAINKKRTPKFLADLQTIHEEYAQSYIEYSSTNNITQQYSKCQP